MTGFFFLFRIIFLIKKKSKVQAGELSLLYLEQKNRRQR